MMLFMESSVLAPLIARHPGSGPDRLTASGAGYVLGRSSSAPAFHHLRAPGALLRPVAAPLALLEMLAWLGDGRPPAPPLSLGCSRLLRSIYG
ncbi:hypothetical protein DFAR_3650009 [Desulfarculales bacterium]